MYFRREGRILERGAQGGGRGYGALVAEGT